MAGTEALVVLIEAIWQLSTEALGYLFVVAAVIFLVQQRDAPVQQRVIHSQRATTLRYGPGIAFGLLLGGLLHAGAPQAPTVFGLVVAGTVAGYTIVRSGVPAPEPATYDSARSYGAVLWLAVPALAIGGLLLGHVLALHVVGLVFYGYLFWNL